MQYTFLYVPFNNFTCSRFASWTNFSVTPFFHQTNPVISPTIHEYATNLSVHLQMNCGHKTIWYQLYGFHSYSLFVSNQHFNLFICQSKLNLFLTFAFLKKDNNFKKIEWKEVSPVTKKTSKNNDVFYHLPIQFTKQELKGCWRSKREIVALHG